MESHPDRGGKPMEGVRFWFVCMYVYLPREFFIS